jgi:hypothetical protein
MNFGLILINSNLKYFIEILDMIVRILNFLSYVVLLLIRLYLHPLLIFIRNYIVLYLEDL